MSDDNQLILGWREWIALPQLGIPAIKAKVDTGARTSAIHAFDIKRETRADGSDWVSFGVYPLQRNDSIARRCHAPLVDVRQVTDSGGHTEDRYFILTTFVIGSVQREIEITLADRNNMLFRMLLGRTALVPDICVDPAQSFLYGRVSAKEHYDDEVSGVKT